jgi:2-C-methyl-D-erythritol 4-phosphate cytidylyltransferase
MLVLAVRALAQARAVDLVVVAAPTAEVEAVRGLLGGYAFAAEIVVVAGGATRQESVRIALAALDPDIDVVLVHDAARPLTPSELVDAAVDAVRAGADAVVPAVPVADTIKRVDRGGRVVETVPREQLRAVQTPQAFRRQVLAAAHAAALGDTSAATDDAGLVERLGVRVQVVPGSPEAFKVTRPIDLVFAEALLARQRAGSR